MLQSFGYFIWCGDIKWGVAATKVEMAEQSGLQYLRISPRRYQRNSRYSPCGQTIVHIFPAYPTAFVNKSACIVIGNDKWVYLYLRCLIIMPWLCSFKQNDITQTLMASRSNSRSMSRTKIPEMMPTFIWIIPETRGSMMASLQKIIEHLLQLVEPPRLTYWSSESTGTPWVISRSLMLVE